MTANLTCAGETAIPVTFIICGIVVVFENSFLLYILLPDYRFHTIDYAFIGSLGVADLLIGVLLLIAGSIRLPALRHKVDYRLFTVQMVVSVGLVFLSGTHMLAIAAEKWLYVVHPFFYQKHVTEKVVWASVEGLWAFSVVYILIVFFWQTQGFGSWPTDDSHLHHYLKSIFIITMYALTLILTFFFYFSILEVARKQRNKIAEQHIHLRRHSTRNTGFMRSLKYFLTTFVVFVAMTIAPVITTYISIYAKLSETVATVSFLLLHLNSGCNFCILFFLDRKFRRSCRSAFSQMHLPSMHIAAADGCGKKTTEMVAD